MAYISSPPKLQLTMPQALEQVGKLASRKRARQTSITAASPAKVCTSQYDRGRKHWPSQLPAHHPIASR
jgi:hypothetical protein